jgi:hypothetical protein
MTAGELADLLHARKVGRDKWIALCPHHGDKTPSLSISVGDKQPIVMTCRSHGCSPKDILAALGLTWRDLMRPQAMTPGVRRQIAEKQKLRELEEIWATCWIGLVESYGTAERDWWRGMERRYWNKMNYSRLCIYGYERKFRS